MREGTGRLDRHTGWLWPALTAAIAFVVAAASMRLWEWTPGTPFGMTGDATPVEMMLKDLRDHGWYWHNNDIGFPFGQNGSLFPELNVLHLGIIKVIGWFCSDYLTPGVLFFVAGFPAAAAAFHLLARSQGIGPWGSLVGGVLFANAPGHQERFGHLYLAAYWVVPMALWLVLQVAGGRLWSVDDDGADVRWRRAATIGSILVVGLSGAYYVGFTALLVAIAAVTRRSVGRPRDLMRGLAVLAGTGAVIALPLFAAKWGSRGEVVTGRLPAERAFGESEIFAGKIMDLLLPWEGHRFDPAAYLTFAYKAGTTPTVEAAALGVVGVVGFVWLTVVGFRSLFGARAEPQVLRWSALMMATVAFYVVGGLGSLTALFITGQLRTWSRLTLFVLGFALLAVGKLLTRWSPRKRWLPAAVAGALVVVGALDQTNPARAPKYAANRALLADLKAYNQALEAATGPGCAVFQLPVLAYPESADRLDMNGYDQLLPYLGSSELKWSSGAMRGTAVGDWRFGLDTSDPTRMKNQLAEAGFCAIEVDTKAFPPGSPQVAALLSGLGGRSVQSRDGQFVSRAFSATATSHPDHSAAVLHPIMVDIGAYGPDLSEGAASQDSGPRASLAIVNLSDAEQTVKISLDVRPQGSSPRTFTIRGEDGMARVARSLPPLQTSTVEVEVRAPARERTSLTMAFGGEPHKSLDSNLLVSGTFVGASATAGGLPVPTSLEQFATGWFVP